MTKQRQACNGQRLTSLCCEPHRVCGRRAGKLALLGKPLLVKQGVLLQNRACFFCLVNTVHSLFLFFWGSLSVCSWGPDSGPKGCLQDVQGNIVLNTVSVRDQNSCFPTEEWSYLELFLGSSTTFTCTCVYASNSDYKVVSEESSCLKFLANVCEDASWLMFYHFHTPRFFFCSSLVMLALLLFFFLPIYWAFSVLHPSLLLVIAFV